MTPVVKLVDVIIPAYNAGTTLGAAIASIQHQTLRKIGIIVVDDGSTDGSGKVLAAIAADDDRVRIVTTPNQGIVDALNTGLRYADANYVARFDADDIAFPDRLARQLDFLTHNKRYVAVGGNVWHIGPDGSRLGTHTNFGGDVVSDPLSAPSKEPYVLHPFLLARRSAIEDAGGYRYVFHAEDTDLYWRMLRVGGLYNLPDIIGEYRIHPKSITGASVINGRISAVYSQLAAISFLRRERQIIDLTFDKASQGAMQAASSLHRMIEIWADRLSIDEQRYLRIAVAAKIMELAAYRPYELEEEDCDFIRVAIMRDLSLVSRRSAVGIGKKVARASWRLSLSGRWREVATLYGARRSAK